MLQESRFDPIDLAQMRLLLQLAPHKRVRLMLEARELAVGLFLDILQTLEAIDAPHMIIGAVAVGAGSGVQR